MTTPKTTVRWNDQVLVVDTALAATMGIRPNDLVTYEHAITLLRFELHESQIALAAFLKKRIDHKTQNEA